MMPAYGVQVLEKTIEARTAVALPMGKGQILRVVDLEGQQAADIVAYNRHSTVEGLSTEVTVQILRTSNPQAGQTIYSIEWNPMLTIIADSVGTNYLPGEICSDEANFFRYGVRGSVNCRDNLAVAVAPWGVSKAQVHGAFAAFLNMGYLPDGRTVIQEPISKPGDYLDLRAEMDVVIAISACPQILNACNAYNPTPLGIVLYEPASSSPS
jgi:uncharacterized protein YcgI (DUF1989 family)